METLTLLPLSQSEIEGSTANWIDAAFAGRLPSTGAATLGDALVRRVLRGGYPDAITRSNPRRRIAWASSYIDALVRRDVREVAGVEKLDHMPRLMRALAQTAGQMCNYTQLGGQVGLDAKTAARYLGVFEQMYLLSRVESWHRNRLSRVVKSPKLQFIDAGLLAALTDLGEESVALDRGRFGQVLETFVFGELLKHASVSDSAYRLLYYRDADQVEVDVVIENLAGRVIGIEVKASASVREADLRGLRKLAALAGDDFAMGVLLHDGAETLPLGDRLWAAPLSSLWWT